MIKPGRYFFLVLLAVFPNLLIFPVPVLIVVCVFMIWAGLYCYKNILRPTIWTLRGATLGSVLFAYLLYGSLANPDAATAILCMITALKLFETQSYRDAMALLLVSLVVVMSYLIQSYSLLASIYMVTVFVLVIYFMMELQRKKYFLKQNIVKISDLFSLEMVVALPLLVALFVFFPRFTTRFGAGERQVQSIGFSDQIQLGQIIALSQSNEVAFKVRFLKQQKLNYDSLYFRGAVLTHNKEMSWRRSTANAVYQSLDESQAPDYQVLMPPRNQKNLFTLENGVITQTTPKLYLFKKPAENIYFSTSAIDYNLSYSVATKGALPLTYEREELSVAVQPSPALEETIKLLDASSTEQKVENILNFFRNGGFSYSTEVPAYKTIEEFFNTKIGFCEHYASGFVILARSLKVPSRIVVGFMGGETNPFDDSLTVRDKFAHAWAEVFIDGKGWTRVDPTAIIYPQRVQNILIANTGQQRFYENFLNNGFLFLESINNKFELMMMNFNSDSQWNILSRISEYFNVRMIVVFLLIPLFFVIFVAIIWWVWRWEFRDKDPLANSYRTLLKKLNRKGFDKKDFEGPMEFEERLKQQNKVPIEYIAMIREYIVLRFSQPPDEGKIKNYSRQIRSLR